MKAKCIAAVVLLLGCAPLQAHDEVQSIHGPGFDGQIFYPQRVHEDTSEGFYMDGALWTPSVATVRAAEKALPGAIADWIQFKLPSQGPNFPTACPSKISTNLRFTSEAADTRPDSVIEGHNFLRDVAPELANFERQYIGVTKDGKKYLFINLSYGPDVAADKYLREQWKTKRWIMVLDGGEEFWDVLYDPATGTFSEWDGD